MSSTCPNCGARLNCSCQRRTASDGKIVCGICINNYEYALKAKEVQKNKSAHLGGITGITIVYNTPMPNTQ